MDGAPPDPVPEAANRAAQEDDAALKQAGRWCVGIAMVVLLWKLGAVSSPGYGPPRWQPWTWRPGVLFRNTTTSGGDTGAHVWTPDFIRRELLPSGRVSGWSKDWYAGFPVLRFYFPGPMWLIALLGMVIPPNIAFKLVTVVGILGLPPAAMVLARAARLDRMYHYLFALAAVVFLFDPHYDILGGNILSTMAGEFSFSISLTAAVLFMAGLIRVMRTGHGRGVTVVALVATSISHMLPSLFAAVAALAIVAVQLPGSTRSQLRRRLGDSALVGAVAAMLVAFWVFPFAEHLPYTNDMGWERATDYVGGWFPPLADTPLTGSPLMGTIVALAAIGLVHQVVRFVRGMRTASGPDGTARLAVVLGVAALVAALAFRFPPQPRILNERALPFYFLCSCLLSCFGLHTVVIVGRRVGGRLGRGRLVGGRLKGRTPWTAAHGVVTVAVLCWYSVGWGLGMVPGWLPVPRLDGGSLGVQRADASDDINPAMDWALYNYNGYQSFDAWPEHRQLIDLMERVGAEQGCGRAMWDYEDELERYGSQMALMLLPLWTQGCISSMEGLYFESSPTVPFHFMNASMLSARPFDPQANLPYPGLNVPLGVDKLQQWGVKYYLVFSPLAQVRAALEPDLQLLGTSPYARECSDEERTQGTCPTSWQVYLVNGSELVEGLAFQPAVATGIEPSQTGGWLDMAMAQYADPARFPVPLAETGPDSWARVAVTQQRSAGVLTVGDGVAVANAPLVEQPVVSVSDIAETDGRVSFTVDRVGVPVVVKESYFPNWRVKGADGPYRLAPNLMVVVPTQRQVTLRFETDGADRTGLVMTLAGAVALVALGRRDRLRRTMPPHEQHIEPDTETETELDAELATSV